MTLERILRSPLVNVIAILLLAPTLLSMYYKETVSPGIIFVFIFLIMGFVGSWIMLVLWHNSRNPERKIHLMSYFPPEFREEDEGQQWMNYRITRRVYIFYCSGIPCTILATYFAEDGKVTAIICLCILGVIQQLIYWWELRRWERS